MPQLGDYVFRAGGGLIALRFSILLLIVFFALWPTTGWAEELQSAQPAYVWVQLLPDTPAGSVGRLVRLSSLRVTNARRLP